MENNDIQNDIRSYLHLYVKLDTLALKIFYYVNSMYGRYLFNNTAIYNGFEIDFVCLKCKYIAQKAKGMKVNGAITIDTNLLHDESLWKKDIDDYFANVKNS